MTFDVAQRERLAEENQAAKQQLEELKRQVAETNARAASQTKQAAATVGSSLNHNVMRHFM